ncbi:MAG TPA: PEP-CTERM sorting domain-containing protein [Terriglobia bacterium]|nr:PEP-CTERM sorting domain-containing protein [Terriglobia bacterium]
MQLRRSYILYILFLVIITLGAFRPASADTVYWTVWGANSGSSPGTVPGTITFPGSTVINVTYSGEIAFSQKSGTGATNWFLPVSTYTSSTVSNASTDGGIVAISGPDTKANTFTFSSPVTNPIFSEVSLGQAGVPMDYIFSAPFVLLSGGANAYWGGSSITQPAPNDMHGAEGDGTIEFLGTFTSLSFTVKGGEYWNGFTVGALAAGTNSPVPEPGTYSMAVMGGLLLACLTLRKRMKAQPHQ